MWATLVVGTVVLAGVAFLLRFLLAMLREDAPSVCYWVVPVRRAREREMLEVLSSDDVEDDWPAAGQPAVALGESPATKPSGIPGQPLRQAGLSGSQIFVRLKIGPPWQSW